MFAFLCSTSTSEEASAAWLATAALVPLDVATYIETSCPAGTSTCLLSVLVTPPCSVDTAESTEVPEEPEMMVLRTEADALPESLTLCPEDPTTMPPLSLDETVCISMTAAPVYVGARRSIIPSIVECHICFCYTHTIRSLCQAPAIQSPCDLKPTYNPQEFPHLTAFILRSVEEYTKPEGCERPSGVRISAAYLTWKRLTALAVREPKCPVVGKCSPIDSLRNCWSLMTSDGLLPLPCRILEAIEQEAPTTTGVATGAGTDTGAPPHLRAL